MQWLGIIAKEDDEAGGERVWTPGAVDKVANIVSGKGASSTSAELLKNKTISKNDLHLDPSKFTKEDWEAADKLPAVYGNMGEIVNLGQMTQRRASEAIEDDIRKHEKAGTQSFYERVGSDLANVGQFRTDARSADGNYVYMARGFSDWWRAKLVEARAKGIDVGDGRITSGIGTLGSEKEVSSHTYTDSWKGHFSSSGLTWDSPRFINKNTGRYLTEKEYAALGIKYSYLEGDHDHLALPGFVSQKEKAKSIALDKKEALIQAAQNSIKVKETELEEAKKKALEDDGKITSKERKELGIGSLEAQKKQLERDINLVKGNTFQDYSITGMREMKNRMWSGTMRDLIQQQIESNTSSR